MFIDWLPEVLRSWRPLTNTSLRRNRDRGAKDNQVVVAERLEDRTLLSFTWEAAGPSPTINGQVEGMNNQNNPVAGPIQTVVANPTNADILYVGSVNGGVWKTLNARSASPTWTPVTDTQPSMSIGAMDLDPTDATGNTIVAGFGRYSAYFSDGSARAGLIRTVDGGTTWVALGEGTLIEGGNISGIASRGQTVLVSTDNADLPSNTSLGLFRSLNGGLSFTQVGSGSGLPSGRVRDLVGSPTSSSTFYLSLTNAGTSSGIYKSTDTGATWSLVSSAAMNALILPSQKVELAAGRSNNVFAAIIGQNGDLTGLFQTADAGVIWNALDLPTTTDNGVVNGLQAARGGNLFLSIAADPQNSNIVYVGGDVQPGPFPNSLSATTQSGRLFRVDASLPAGTQAVSMTNFGTTSRNSSPHAGSREIVFDAAGNLIEVDEGGIYRRSNPRVNGDWSSVNGNLQITEIHSIAYDSVGNVLIGGTEDTGTSEQFVATPLTPLTWRTVNQGDGGVVAVDDQTFAAQGQSIRYSSSQLLTGFQRRTVDANSNVINTLPVQLRVGNQSLFTVDRNIPYYPVYKLNAVDPTRGVLGTQTLYESFNQFDNLLNISGPTGADVIAMAYGGKHLGIANPDVLYYATADTIYYRENAADTPIQLDSYPGDVIQDIVLDPNDYHRMFVIDLTDIYVTNDAGTTWQTISGNIDQLASGQLRSIEYVDLPGTNTDALVVGATGGVFSNSLNVPSVWARFGVGLPNLVAIDLEYDKTDDVLTVGSLGRGAFIMRDASYTFNPPTKTGSVDFSQSVYQIGNLVDITVRDLDLLNTNLLTVTVVSDSGDQEQVQLTEIAGTGVFRGQLATATTDNGFVIGNGTMEVDRGAVVTVTYRDASTFAGTPATFTDTAQLFSLSSLYNFTFTDPAGQPTDNGFTASGLWHLSVGHGLDAGHSPRDSFYFGLGESLTSTGSYVNNSSGTLTSPLLSLVGGTAPIFLEFNHLLEGEDQFDTATVTVISNSGSTIIASSNGLNNLPDSTQGSWVHEAFDLSGFVGQQIRVEFSFTTNDTINGEGWYVDDIQLSGPAAEIRGTKFQDTNGNGIRESGEPGLPGWVIFVDGNGDGLPDDTRQVFNSTSGEVPIADNTLTDTTINVSDVNGLLKDLDVRVTILHPRDGDLQLTLISPAGTRVPLVNSLGGNGANFSGTTFDDQASTGIQFGVAPYAGEFRPQSPLSVLNGEPANGTWHLEIIDNATGNVGRLVNWSLTTSVGDASTVTDANGDYVLSGLRAGTYTVAEVMQNGWQQTFPHNSLLAPFTYTVTLGTGQLATGLDFGNQFVFPVVKIPSGDLTYTENDPPVVIDGRATVTDINTDTSQPQLAAFANGSLTVSLTANATNDDRLVIRNQGTGIGQIGVFGNAITYEGLFIGTFTGGVGLNPLNIKFNIQATQPAVQALLRNIQFSVIGDDPSALPRTVEFIVTDNTQGISAPVSKLIHVIPVNDVPVVTLTQTPLTYLENGPPTPIDVFAAVSDPDSPNFDGGSLTVTLDGNSSGPISNTRQVFTSVDTPYVLNNNTITSRISTLGLNGVLTDVNVRVNITHTNDADLVAFLISPQGTRVKLFSNVGASNFFSTIAQNMTNTVFDDAAQIPILSTFAQAPFTGSFLPEKELFTVNSEDPNGFWSLEITDLQRTLVNDGTGILNNWSIDLGITEVSANETLSTINQGSQTGEIGLVGNRVTYSGTVIGTYKGGIGTTPLVVSFNANATQDAVQSLMQNIAVQIQGDNPIGGSRQAEFIIDDGDGGISNPVFRTINIVSQNDAPVLTLPAGQSTYIEGSAPTVLDVFATVSDIDSPNFDTGVLTVSLGNTAASTDRLAIRPTGQNAGQINLLGGSVRFGTTVIGTFSGGIGSNPLIVNLSNNATPVAVQALVRSITFQATGASPSTIPRVAQFQISDGDGGTSSVVSKTITVSQLNDPPVLTLSTAIIPPDTTPVSQVVYNASGLAIIVDSGVTVTDPDNSVFGGGRLTVTLSSGASTRDRLGLATQGSLIVAVTNIFFANTLVGKLTPGVGSLPLTVDFNPSASREAVQAVARAVTFQILGPGPTAGNRIATFVLTDGSGGTSQPQDRTIIVQTSNQPPVNTVPTVDYTTLEDVSVALTGLGMSDSDASLQPVQVTLSVQRGVITVLTNVIGGVTAANVTGNGTKQVVLIGDQISINTTLQALNGVKYVGVLDYSGQDTLTMTTNDLGNSGPGGALTDIDSVFINIQSVHDNAKITPTATTALNVRGKEALIDTGITSQLGDGQTSLNKAVLTINVTAGRNRSDRLRLLTEGTGSTQINVVAGKKGKPSNVKLGTLVIGTVTGGENGVPLKITFNANAQAADLQKILRRITFRTAVQTTVFGLRTITYNFTDALGLPASPATKAMNVIR